MGEHVWVLAQAIQQRSSFDLERGAGIMAQSVAQALTVSMPVAQTLDIGQSDRSSQAQSLTVSMGTGYIIVDINPAQQLPAD